MPVVLSVKWFVWKKCGITKQTSVHECKKKQTNQTRKGKGKCVPEVDIANELGLHQY